MTITGTEAYEAMRTHHRMLSEQLAAHVSAVSEAVTAGQPHEAAVAGLIALAEQVLPHAAAEEQAIYPAATAHADLAGTVSAMTPEHKALSVAAGRLASLTGGAAAAEQARDRAGPRQAGAGGGPQPARGARAPLPGTAGRPGRLRGDLGFAEPCRYANLAASLDGVTALGPEYRSFRSAISGSGQPTASRVMPGRLA